ncbi:hypothetical protein CBW65_13930 [Tumebacillus avium]|uniref:Uncharacterized protein n=1 Tax=Tumebacillus avium TaxID=1903704 RepID=A0A1Y0IN65_9BACL|nr:hypothetical protein [Tumebacillus avium]ARU61978.1 hypothetical protein CBW65_13930 [Tumebacillus avium]
MRRYFQIGLALFGLWLLWLMFAFVTFKEMEILLAYLVAIVGGGFFALYFLIGYLLYRSRNRKKLVKLLLLLLGALVLAGAGRFGYFMYESSHPGRNIDFSAAQELTEGTHSFVPGEEKRFTIHAAADSPMQLEMKFTNEEELYSLYTHLYDESGKKVGTYSRSVTSIFLTLDEKTGPTYYLQIINADALNPRSVEIRKNRP